MIGSGNMPSLQINHSWLHRGRTIRPRQCTPLSPAAACILKHIPARADWQRKTKSALSKKGGVIIWLGSRVALEISQRSGVKCSSLERHKVTTRCTGLLRAFISFWSSLELLLWTWHTYTHGRVHAQWHMQMGTFTVVRQRVSERSCDSDLLPCMHEQDWDCRGLQFGGT